MLFFFKIINTQAQMTQAEITGRMLTEMEDIIVGKSVSTDAAAEIEIFDKEFLYTCQEPCSELIGCKSWFEIEKSPNIIEFNTEPLFSLRSFQSEKMFAFASGWDVPFHAANFLYIAVPGEKIVMQSPCTTGLCYDVYKMVPQALKDNKIVVIDDGTAVKGDFVKYVNFTTNSCRSYSGRSICINESERRIYFYKNGMLEQSTFTGYPYLFEESILGAMFSEDSGIFECNMKKAFFKLKGVFQVLGKKAEYFQRYYGGLPKGDCQQVTGSVIDLANGPLLKFNVLYSNTINIPEIETAGHDLENKNKELMRKSCSSIY